MYGFNKECVIFYCNNIFYSIKKSKRKRNLCNSFWNFVAGTALTFLHKKNIQLLS